MSLKNVLVCPRSGDEVSKHSSPVNPEQGLTTPRTRGGKGANPTPQDTLAATRTRRYWITPPELYQKLHQEFNFDFDPCPHPRPPDFNSLVIPWGEMNFVNPPFHRLDGGPEGGTTAFVRKAISEHKQGRKSALFLPVPLPLALLISEGAELRNMGRIQFRDIGSGEPNKKGSVICLAILK